MGWRVVCGGSYVNYVTWSYLFYVTRKLQVFQVLWLICLKAVAVQVGFKNPVNTLHRKIMLNYIEYDPRTQLTNLITERARLRYS